MLPPAGALSSQPSVLTAPVEGRSHHASCALQCQGHEHFGIENSGLFCFCLSAAEVAAARPLHPAECAGACSLSFIAPEQLWMFSGKHVLPCGGVEAIAVFDGAAVRAALRAPLRSRHALGPAATSALPG